ALRHLALHQEHRALRPRRLERMEEDRRRYVVRNVAREHVRTTGEFREIRLQYIRLDDRHRGAACIALLKMRREIAVQLYRDQPLRAFGEQVGDRTTTRADLDH